MTDECFRIVMKHYELANRNVAQKNHISIRNKILLSINNLILQKNSVYKRPMLFLVLTTWQECCFVLNLSNSDQITCDCSCFA